MKTTRWKDVREGIVTPEDEADIHSVRELMRAEQRLADLRRRRHMSVEARGEKLFGSQPIISQVERADDV